MSSVTSSPPDSNPALKPSVQVGATLHWMVGIFLLCLLLVVGLRGYFTDLETDIQQRGGNERARLFVGDEIVRGIQGIEKDIYRMAVTQNAHEFARIKTSVDTRMDKVRHDLGVLKTGGTSRRLVRLNTTEQEELTREAHFQPNKNDTSVVMEIIEIQPQLDQVQSRTEELAQMLTLRWQSLETSDQPIFFQNEERVALSLKQMAAYFERLNENANRLFLEGDQRLRALELELQERTTELKRIETGLTVLVVLLGGFSGILYMRRLTAALNGAHQATRDTERQREQNATILNTLSDGVYTTNMEGNIAFINAAGERILGWTAGDLVGQPSHQSIHHSRPDGSHFPREECPLIAVLREGVSLDSEEHFINRDGTFVPVAYRSKPLTQDGQVVGSLVSFHDITERLQSQARIRLQQAALDAAANMIVITDQYGVIDYVNPAFCQATGYSAEEAIGANSKILNSGYHEASFYRQMWETLSQGKPWEGEIYNRRKNGEIYPEQMTITPIYENGTVAHFVAIKRDITQELETRTRLKLVETAIQEIEQGIFITDATAHALGPTVEYVNAGFCRMLAYTSQDIVGARAGLLRGPGTDPAKLAQIHASMTTGESLLLEMVFQRKDGTSLSAELHLSPVHNEQAVVTHYIGVLTDIGLRQQTEAALLDARDQALENSRLKSEFLSTMSHEIRTPMNGIIGMTDLLMDTQLDTEQRDFTQIVRDSAQALLVIINDILDYSKIEAGKLDVEITDFSPLEVVEGTTELLLAKAREKSLWLTSFVDPSLPALMQGDPTRLRQVLLNLISNAIKFTEQGGVELSAQQVQAGSQAMIRFDVRDTGIGISPAVQAKLFTSFTQADSSTTRKYGGTGLGLAICKRLVELMGGQIGISSQLGEGSSFWFTLPLTAVSASLDMPHVPHATASPKGMRVLVVDDQAIDRKIIDRYLNSWGMVSDGARNAAEALKLLRDAADLGQAFDVALIDLVMPGMDGLELAQVVRADHRLDSVRLVLLTGHDRRNLADQATQAGFFACLTKPVRQSLLFDSLTGHRVLFTPLEPTDLSRTHAQDAGAHRPLILLAEDNLINQKVAQLQISKLGYALHIVNNGQEALDAVQSTRSGHNSPAYAAILMDCQMPIMDGFEATAAIRLAHMPGEPRIPIIAMTANAMQGDRERCLQAGMDDYVSKPIAPEQLGQVLSRWIEATQNTPCVNVLESSALSEPLINFELLEDYFGDEPDTIRRLLTLFETTSGALVDKLGQAITQRDAASACALAHELKGSCGNMGIERMARIAADLEVAAQELQWPLVDSLQKELALTFKDTLHARKHL